MPAVSQLVRALLTSPELLTIIYQVPTSRWYRYQESVSKMYIAYADPPYPGMAHRYPENQEVDYLDLVSKLISTYDGWALSLHTPSLRDVLNYFPDGYNYRIAAWVKPFASFKPNVNPAYTWEPVIFKPARKISGRTTRDHLICNAAIQRGLFGAKSALFARWIFLLLGADPSQDNFTDLYPGTNIFNITWENLTINNSYQLL